MTGPPPRAARRVTEPGRPARYMTEPPALAPPGARQPRSSFAGAPAHFPAKKTPARRIDAPGGRCAFLFRSRLSPVRARPARGHRYSTCTSSSGKNTAGR